MPYWQMVQSRSGSWEGSKQKHLYRGITVLGHLVEVSCRMLWKLFQTSHATAFTSRGSNTLPLHLGDSSNVEALRKDTPCRSERTLVKTALQPAEMWSCQDSRCCILSLPQRRCESKVVLVRRYAPLCALKKKMPNFVHNKTIFNFVHNIS